MDIYTPSLCNETAFARLAEEPVHFIQCRLITPDSEEQKTSYLKSVKRHNRKHHHVVEPEAKPELGEVPVDTYPDDVPLDLDDDIPEYNDDEDVKFLEKMTGQGESGREPDAQNDILREFLAVLQERTDELEEKIVAKIPQQGFESPHEDLDTEITKAGQEAREALELLKKSIESIGKKNDAQELQRLAKIQDWDIVKETEELNDALLGINDRLLQRQDSIQRQLDAIEGKESKSDPSETTPTTIDKKQGITDTTAKPVKKQAAQKSRVKDEL